MPTDRTEGDLPDSCFGYVPGDGPASDRKLRLCSLETGELDAGIVGAAAAALGPGYRGQKVQLPAGEREAAVRRVRAAWRRVHPDRDDDEMPSGIHMAESGIGDDGAPPMLYAEAVDPAPDRGTASAAVRTWFAVRLADAEAIPDAEWIPCLPPPGAYRHAVYGDLTLTDADLDTLVAHVKARTYQDFLPVNAEHLHEVSGAIGWIEDARRTEDGAVDVFVRWSERGKKVRSEDRFRYVSAGYFLTWQDHFKDGQDFAMVLFEVTLCTNPHFKPSSLRPLSNGNSPTPGAIAASEGVVAAPVTPIAGDPGTEATSMSERDPKEPTPTPAPEPTPTPAPAPTPEPTPKPDDPARHDLVGVVELSGKLRTANDRVRQLTDRLALTEAELATARTELTEERKARVEEWARNEITGNSSENGTAWYGPEAENLAWLFGEAIEHGQDSEEVKRLLRHKRQEARAVKASEDGLFDPISAGGIADASGDVVHQVARLTEMKRRADPNLSPALAESLVFDESPDLYVRYLNARR